jgi:hypothetical protein
MSKNSRIVFLFSVTESHNISVGSYTFIILLMDASSSLFPENCYQITEILSGSLTFLP